MNKLTTSLWLSCLLTSGLTVHAQVDEGQVVPLVAGDPARAADLNQTTQALITAINNNAAQIQALNEQLSIIASVINLPQPSLEQNLAGSVYQLSILEISSGASDVLVGEQRTQRLRQSFFGETGTLTLNPDNSASVSLSFAQNESNLVLASGVPLADPNAETPSYGTITHQPSTANETLTGTWSLAGNVLTLVLGEGEDQDTATFNVSVDGNTLLTSSSDTESDPPITMHYSSLDVGVRISKPTPNIEIEIDEVYVDGGVFFNRRITYNTGAIHDLFWASGNGTVNNEAKRESMASGGKKIYIMNTGNADLVIGSHHLTQSIGSGISTPNLPNQITIAPNTGPEILVTDSVFDETSLSHTDAAGIYLMSNDPDTPTVIVSITSG